MARKFLIDGNWLICSEGTCMQRMLVKSQKTVYAHGKLVATMNDRMDNNFYCLKMVSAGAMVGAIVGAAAAAGAVFTGGATIGGIIAAVGTSALTGSISGKLLSLMPCICACLTKPNKWTSVKNSVLIQNQMALMPDAKLNCLLGGMVSIILPQIEIVLDALELSGCAYNVDNKDSPKYKKNKEIPNEWSEIKDFENEFEGGITEALEDSKSGFKARLFKKDKTYILAFAGTDPKKDDNEKETDWRDIITDGRQAFGVDDKDEGQFASAVSLSQEVDMKVKEKKDYKLVITGHSLGGGLATIAGAATGADTYTFNAAGVHEWTFKDQDISSENTKHIQSYYSNKDILNIVQNNRTILAALLASSKCSLLSFLGSGIFLTNSVPQVSGQRIGLDTDASDWLSAHSLEGSKLKEALLGEKKNSPDVQVFTK